MNTKINYLISKDCVVVNFDGKTASVHKSDPAYQPVISAIKAGNLSEIPTLICREEAVKKASGGAFEVRNGMILVDGQEVRGELGLRIMEFYNEQLPMGPLVAFARKVRLNPSFRAVNDLFSFLDKNKHPITEDGNFIAYKRVHAADDQGRYLDIHSKTMDNAPGKTLEMPRNQVDEDPTRTCSSGLHVANWDYAANVYGSGTGVMLEVAVSPEDVVAIPVDYNQAKMRVCKYTVIGEVKNANENKHLVRNLNQQDEEEVSNVSHDVGEEPEEEECWNGECEDCGELLSLCECDSEEDEEDDEIDSEGDHCGYCDEKTEDCECDICSGCACLIEDCYCDEESEEEEKEDENSNDRPDFNAILSDEPEPTVQ